MNGERYFNFKLRASVWFQLTTVEGHCYSKSKQKTGYGPSCTLRKAELKHNATLCFINLQYSHTKELHSNHGPSDYGQKKKK